MSYSHCTWSANYKFYWTDDGSTCSTNIFTIPYTDSSSTPCSSEPAPLIDEEEAKCLSDQDVVEVVRSLLPILTRGVTIDKLPPHIQEILKMLKACLR